MKYRHRFNHIIPPPRTIAEMAVATLTIIIFCALLAFAMIGLAEMVEPEMHPEKVSAKDLRIEARYRADH